MCEFNSNFSFWIIHRRSLPIWHHILAFVSTSAFGQLTCVLLVTTAIERWPRMNDFFIDRSIDRSTDPRHMGIKVPMWFGFGFECTVMPTLWPSCLPCWITKILIILLLLGFINRFSLRFSEYRIYLLILISSRIKSGEISKQNLIVMRSWVWIRGDSILRLNWSQYPSEWINRATRV